VPFCCSAKIANPLSSTTSCPFPCSRLLAFSGFPFPITLTMWHMSFCSAVGFVCVRVLGITKSHNLSLRDYTQRVLPIGEALLPLTQGCCCLLHAAARTHALVKKPHLSAHIHTAWDALTAAA